MDLSQLHYVPTFDPVVIGNRLGELLVPGQIGDSDFDRRIARLEKMFRSYAASSPYGLWAPGLVITREMRLMCEAYLPLEEIGRAFHRLLSHALKFAPSLPVGGLQNSLSWFDVLHRQHSVAREANPARILRQLLDDGDFRCRFLFALFLPCHFGGGFNRYPEQAAFLRRWLEKTRHAGRVRCLDAACGSGEGTYELAMLLLECGADPEGIDVHGVTVEPLELFAAAHGWFPHDPVRQEAFRRRIERLVACPAACPISFSWEDLNSIGSSAGGGFDIVLCNGLLGGPFMNSREIVERTVARLCSRLRPGGMLMAADRFHGGWKRSIPGDLMREVFAGSGLEVLAPDEGVAGVKR